MKKDKAFRGRLQRLLQAEVPIRMHPGMLLVLTAIFLLGINLRIESVLRTVVVAPIRADARDYVAYAYNLRHFDVYSRSLAAIRKPGAQLKPDAVRSPGYPLFLTAFMGHLPDARSLREILLVQALLSALVIGIGYALYRHFLDPPWAAAAAGLTAMSPHLVTMNVYLLSETLFTFLLVSGIWLLVAAQQRGARSLYVLAGIVLGATALTRPGIQYFVPLLAVWVYWMRRDRRGLEAGALLVAGFLAAVLPWTVRNLLSIGALSNPALMINFLHHGMYPGFMYHGDPRTLGFPYRFDPQSAEISRSVGSVLQAILHRFRTEPWTELSWYLFGKPVTLWSWNILGGFGDVFVYPIAATPYANVLHFRVTHWLMHVLHWPLVISGLVGAILVWWNRFVSGWAREAILAARVCSLLLAYSTLIHMIGAPFPRYSIPLRPFLFAMAMLPWAQITVYVHGLVRGRVQRQALGQSSI